MINDDGDSDDAFPRVFSDPPALIASTTDSALSAFSLPSLTTRLTEGGRVQLLANGRVVGTRTVSEELALRKLEKNATKSGT